jgi:hypothetical protein
VKDDLIIPDDSRGGVARFNIYVNTEPMLLTKMTSRKSSENKSRSYRQCVETI